MMVRKTILLSLMIVSGFFASGQAKYVTDSIVSGGIYRRYLLYVPAMYSPTAAAAPLLFNFHGEGSNAGDQLIYGSFLKVADTAGCLVVHPQGTGASAFWNAGLQPNPDDAKFVGELIDSLKLSYNIDLQRVYACGYSNGGSMALYLACSLHSKIAAVGAVAGTMMGNWFLSCKPSRAMPVILVNGTADAVVPYGGSSLYVNSDTVIRKWVQHNKSATSVTVNIADTSSGDGCQAVRYTYENGIDDSSVELFKIVNGGHTWPGGPPYYPNTNYDMSASAEIWRFFRSFRLSQFSTKLSIAETAFEGGMKVFPNPASSYLQLNANEPLTYNIVDAFGKMIADGIAKDRIDVSGLPGGVYLLQVRSASSVRSARFIKASD